MRVEEIWALQIIAAELGVDVVGNDDNSCESMFDLRIGPREAPEFAIEVVGAVDEAWTETWNVGPARPGQRWDVSGDWMLSIESGTHLKALRRELPAVFTFLEERGVRDVDVKRYGSHRLLGSGLVDTLDRLGVSSLHCFEPAGSGKTYMTMPGQGGMVHEDGNLLADWVVEFLTHPQRRDVLKKLTLAANAGRREVFIPVTFMGAPWSVTSYLTGTLEHLPSSCPVLPAPIDGVWLAPTQSFHESFGVRWDGSTWSLFGLCAGSIDPG